jgi:anion-transporting  ArsA/GET3 family ATPase
VKNQNPLADALGRRRVLVCVGSGGVGKTTVAATLALRAAVDGRSALVCTIDPARRLADSLGVPELGNEEALISPQKLASAGLSPKANLHAMMLDMKRTWDDLIHRYAPPDKRERILANRFYQSLSSALAGSQEYIAMEKLWELRGQRDYELIVLDTPPTAHALDFLDAPNRVLDFLDNDAAKWLLTPALRAGKLGLQLFNLGGSYVAKTLAKLTGAELLTELANFLLAMSGMNQDFRDRAQEVRDLLTDAQTAFVLVTGPYLERIDEVIHFHTLLRQNHMAVAAVVVNRVHLPPSDAQREAARRLPRELKEKVEATLDEAAAIAAVDAAGIAELQKQCEPTPLIRVPRFDLDVHDLAGLWQTSRFLVGEEVA